MERQKTMKTILITGAGSGIGKETAKLFAAKGWNVIATMREPKNDKTFAEMDHVTVMKLDVTNKEDIETVASEVISQGGLDVLFNNAGIGVKGCLDATPEESIRQVFETDFMGPAEIMKAFIPYFKTKKSGVLMTTASMSGVISLPYDSVYAAAKHALIGLCESLYYELLPYGIRVKILIPGPINTNFKMQTFISSFNSAHNLKPSKNLSKILIPDFNSLPEAKEVAQVAYEAATSDSDQLEYIIGDVANTLISKYRSQGVEAFKKELANEVYEK